MVDFTVMAAGAVTSDPVIIALIGGPVAGVVILIGVIVTSIRNGRSADKNTAVSSREASTHEFDVMRQAFLDSLEELRTQLKETRDEAARDKAESKQETQELRGRVEDLELQNASLVDMVEVNTQERNEILAHMEKIEAMVPVPPGPPPRPVWRFDNGKYVD